MKVRYYDVQRIWSKKIVPVLKEQSVIDTLHKDFGKYAISRCGRHFSEGDVPADFETCDWRYGRRGRLPAFWDYVCHSACHWLVNLNLRLATSVEPKSEWRILTSDLHSTVFDGVDTLFDMNFLALGVKSEEAYKMATQRKSGGRSLKVGSDRRTYYFAPLVPSIAERALQVMKGHPDYNIYLSVCYECATDDKVPGKEKLGMTPTQLRDILSKLNSEQETQK